MIYFISGHKGIGKTYTASKVSEQSGVNYIDTGPIIRKKYQEANSTLPFDQWLNESQQIYGKDFSNKLVCEELESVINDDLIIVGNRSIKGINYIISHFNISEFLIVYIEGDYKLLYENYIKREKKDISMEEFMDIIKLENKMGIDEIKVFTQEHCENSLYYYKKENNNDLIDDLSKIVCNNKKVKNNKVKKKEVMIHENFISNKF